MYNIHLLPAAHGDSILIEYGVRTDPNYILIDGGPHYTFDKIITAIKRIAPKLHTLELVVVTHSDADHIEGIIKLLNRDTLPFRIKDIWFNGWEQLEQFSDLLGRNGASLLGELLKRKGYPHNQLFNGKPICLDYFPDLIRLDGGMELRLLSPTKEVLKKLAKVWEEELKKEGLRPEDAPMIFEEHKDNYRYKDKKGTLEPADLLGDTNDIETLATAEEEADKKEANGSSIAFIASYQNKSCLFAGDAHSIQLQTAIQELGLLGKWGKLSIDAWKLSHHGSKKSTLKDLMYLIDCPRILISTNGSYNNHPDKETLARLLYVNESKLSFYFNYKSEETAFWEDILLQEQYGYESFFPKDGEDWVTIELI